MANKKLNVNSPEFSELKYDIQNYLAELDEYKRNGEPLAKVVSDGERFAVTLEELVRLAQVPETRKVLKELLQDILSEK